MTKASILGLGTAVPAHRYQQMDICHGLAPAFNNRRAPAIFRATQIETRHSVLGDYNWLIANPNSETRHNRYIAEAPLLGRQAIQNALDNAGLSLDTIDHFIAVSCTGVDTPGLDVILAQKMNMSPFLRRTALVGMGCHGLMPALYQAAGIVQVHPQSKILILTVELCTIHFQHNRSIKNILGSALFADGASAVIVGAAQRTSPYLLDSLCYSNYQTQKEMSFHPGNSGYQIYLSSRIPDILKDLVPGLLDRFLKPHHLQIDGIKHWIVHPGGMKIVDYLEEILALNDNELQYARAILRQYGNMSSATLLFVLQRLIEQANPARGEYGLIIGFGPGVTTELGLLRW